MIHETKANVVVADGDIHPLIEARFGGRIPLIDAKDWLAGIRQTVEGEHSQASEHMVSHVLAVAAVEGSGMEKDLEAMALQLHLPFHSFKQPAEEEIVKWVVEVALSHAQEASVDAAQARVSAAILRQDLDRQQQAFHALERAVKDFGMPQFTLALDSPLTPERLVLSGYDCLTENLKVSVDAVGHLQQRLPVSARRIAAVEFHVDMLADPGTDGFLEVSIRDLAANILTTPISIDVSELSSGWNRINFNEVIDCTDRDATLHLSLTGNAAVGLTLSPCMPAERFHPSMQDGVPIGDSPLAMKVWRGLIGVRPQLPPVKKSEGNLIRLRAGEMPKAQLLKPANNGDMAFDLVQYWVNEDGFLVHPPASGMSVALIEKLEFDNLNSVTAIVNNGHRDGPPLLFAIGIAVRLGNQSLIQIPDMLGPWLTLPPLGWGEVHAVLPESTSGKFDLVLVTMVAKGHENRNSWGLFRGFIFNTENLP
ncbi:MAG: hypothetical protein RLZZ505_2809 [Verrucomicrobiota bacterium]|jgi:hypothetical protein